MSEISKEAWDEALELEGKEHGAIAAALQAHIDELKLLALDYAEEYSISVSSMRERGEKAERQLVEEREWYAAAKRGLDEANTSKAELIAEVREHAKKSVFGANSQLLEILAKHEGKQP